MITKQDIVNLIFKNNKVYQELDKTKLKLNLLNKKSSAYAPSNIALCKYWGKRNIELNLPVTSSLSLSLGNKGATTSVGLYVGDNEQDKVILNNEEVNFNSVFYIRLKKFLDLFRLDNNFYFKIDTKLNIPYAAGLASSACGFAALVLALNKFFGWNLSLKDLSILARLGSGSAARSLQQGFIYWNKGENEDGSDSYAEKIDSDFTDVMFGLIILTDKQKSIGSTEAMNITKDTSVLYKSWPYQVKQDMELIRQAIQNKDFNLLGKSAENNALAMHATMQSSIPAIYYANADTVNLMHKVWKLRADGLDVYFTQDAGPNIKLLFHKKDKEIIQAEFNNVEIVNPYQ
tara:strand:- start:1929 stop:2966 length:1038 start_codon:yes stop_codon:yes gene_type:complete